MPDTISGYFDEGSPRCDHLIIIYLLYLLNSVVSYLLIYKKTLVDAHQMNYITVMYHNGFLVLQDICQIIVLLLTQNFILFLVVAVVCTINRKYLYVQKSRQAVSISERTM